MNTRLLKGGGGREENKGQILCLDCLQQLEAWFKSKKSGECQQQETLIDVWGVLFPPALLVILSALFIQKMTSLLKACHKISMWNDTEACLYPWDFLGLI